MIRNHFIPTLYRYILTNRGIAQMIEKYQAGDFGHCPRVYCENQVWIQNEDLSQFSFTIFSANAAYWSVWCPWRGHGEAVLPKVYGCIYSKIFKVHKRQFSSKMFDKQFRHHHTDGAYFGTGFPHILFMVHPEYRPKQPANQVMILWNDTPGFNYLIFLVCTSPVRLQDSPPGLPDPTASCS